ncbi:hypothetical protein L0152_12395 [bacterium]|nr:hypothetical protein [bacterium]
MNSTSPDLSELWSEIYQEAIQLCDSIERLPDQCECGDADAHLEGRCRCCNQNEPAHGHGENCNTILERLRVDLSMFCRDFSTIASPIESAIGTEYIQLRRGIFLAAADLQQIVKTVERVSEAVAGFRRTCDLTELRGIKRHTAELRAHLQIVKNKMDGN